LTKELNGQPSIKVFEILKEMYKKMIRIFMYRQNLFHKKASNKITMKVYINNMKMRISTKRTQASSQKKFKTLK